MEYINLNKLTSVVTSGKSVTSSYPAKTQKETLIYQNIHYSFHMCNFIAVLVKLLIAIVEFFQSSLKKLLYRWINKFNERKSFHFVLDIRMSFLERRVHT